MEGRRRVYAVALPFLAYSHFNAFLHLSRMLATKGVTVIYVNLPSSLQILRPRVQGWDSPLPTGRQNVSNISRDMLPLEALMAELADGSRFGRLGPFWAFADPTTPQSRRRVGDPKGTPRLRRGWIGKHQDPLFTYRLEERGQPLLWVLRPLDSKLDDESSSTAKEWTANVLPDGYERRLGERYLMESFWAPQASVLAHEATGAFITHCGWNSALESVAAGVPMITLPLHSDQPAIAFLLVEGKLAVEIKMNDGVAKREEVERDVRRLMAMDEVAEKMKRRVRAVSKAAVAQH